MTTVYHALQHMPVHFIALIGRQNGMGIDSNLAKQALIARVAPVLQNPARLPEQLARLSSPARQALQNLQGAGGRMPVRLLARRHGALRPPRQIIHAVRQAGPLSPPEQLALLGLIFVDRQLGDVFIPAGLLPHLPPLPDASPPAEPHRPVSPGLLAHDLAVLLALLQSRAVYPLHGRWLPPRALNRWGQMCRVPPATPRPRSELQTGRRRLLHYLADAAGLVTAHSPSAAQTVPTPADHNPITLLPAAWQWLNLPPGPQLQTLWQVWLNPAPERWRQYRLPGYTWLENPAALLPLLHQTLLQLDPANPGRFARRLLQQHPHLLDLAPPRLRRPAARLIQTTTQLLSGPLCRLGVLQPVAGRLALTAAGQALISGQAFDAGTIPPAAKFTLRSHTPPNPLDGRFILIPPAGLPAPADVLAALELAEWPAGAQPTPNNSPPAELTLHPHSVSRALQRGWSPPGLVDALQRLAGRPLTGQEEQQLDHWVQAAGRVSLRSVCLLETTDPGVITRLSANRRGRALIQRTLSPRAVVTDPAKTDQLTRRLTEQEGVPPIVETGKPKKAASQHPASPPWPAALWLAVQFYRRLGQIIELPARMPPELVEWLQAALTPADMAAAHNLTEQAAAAFTRALDGQAAFAPWPEKGLPPPESRAVIEHALQRGQNLRLHYYAVSSGSLQWRTVEPYRLEQRGSVFYMAGFCHRAQAERLFRLDRIRAIEAVSPD